MPLRHSTIILLALIFMTGALTIYTDLTKKKIYNHHLAVLAFLGLAVLAWLAVLGKEDILPHLAAGALAFLIGWFLHHLNVWRGGDAKLFSVYALLMPSLGPVNGPFAPAVGLFACSFIAGMIILLPVFIKDMATNRRAIVQSLLSPVKLRAMAQAAIRVVMFSWVLYPLLDLTHVTSPLVILTASYLIFSWGCAMLQRYNMAQFFRINVLEISVGFLLGVALRWWLFPDSLSLFSLTRYMAMTALSIVLSTGIYTTFEHFKDYHQRVCFAPLLFLGCLLSYTPFLPGLMQGLSRWNVLLYR